MCTGNFFQFWPAQSAINVNREEIFDFGHATPITWQKIYFHFAHHGLTLIAMGGNKIKRKMLLPLYLPFLIIGFPWIAYRLRYLRGNAKALEEWTDYYHNVEKFSYSLPAMFSKDIMMVLEKKNDCGHGNLSGPHRPCQNQKVM